MAFLDNLTPNMRMMIGMGLMGQNPAQGAMQGMAQARVMDQAAEDRKLKQQQAQQQAQQLAARRAALGLPSGSPAVPPAATGAPTPLTGGLAAPSAPLVAGSTPPMAAPQPNKLMQDLIRRKWENLGQPPPASPVGAATATPNRAAAPPLSAAASQTRPMAAAMAAPPNAGASSGVDPRIMAIPEWRRRAIAGLAGKDYISAMDAAMNPERKIVNIGGVPYYADTKEPVIPGVGVDPKQTALMQNAEYLGIEPNDPRLAEKFLSSGGVTVENNIGPQGVDYGKPPKDMAWARTPNGQIALQQTEGGYMAPIAVPVAGGPVETEREAVEEQAAGRRAQEVQTADLVLDDINRTLADVEASPLTTTGLIGGALSNIRQSEAGSIRGRLETIKANIGFDRLQRMRANSPTGGALGQVSDKEREALNATMGNLEQSADDEEFLYNLRRVKEAYLDAIHGTGNRPSEAPDYSTMSDEELLKALE